MKTYFAILFTLLLFTKPLFGLEVKAKLDSNEIPTGGYTFLNIEISNESRADVIEPQVNGLSIRRSGTSSNTSIVNGRISKSVTLRLQIMGEKEGEYIIPPIEVKSGKKKAFTDEYSIKVTNTPSKNRAGQGNTSKGLSAEQIRNIAFIKISTASTKVFIGEKTPLTIQLYLNTDSRFDQITELPNIQNDAILIDSLGDPSSQTVERVGNYQYEVYRWDTSFTGVKAGQTTLESNVELSVLVRARREANPRSLFDSMFSTPSYQRIPLLATSNQTDIEIAPFPENQPDSFNGAIGDFEFHVQADPTTITEGDPITLNISITGKGNFDRVLTDGLAENASFKSYTPEISFIPNENDSLRGTKVFKQAIIPLDPSITEIPSLTFTYLNSKEEVFKTIQTSPIPISVTPSLNKRESTTPENEPASAQRKSIHSDGLVAFSQTLSKPKRTLTPLRHTPQALLFLALTPVAILILSILTSIIAQRSNTEEIKRSKIRDKAIKSSLKRVELSAKSGDREHYVRTAAEHSKTLLSYLLKMEAQAITPGDVKSKVDGHYPKTLEVLSLSECLAYAGADIDQVDIHSFQQTLAREWTDITNSFNTQ